MQRLRSVNVVVCDLDGTLLTKEGDIYDTTVDLIRQLQSHSVRIILCSGRSPHSMHEIQGMVGITEWFISCDGAYVHDASTNIVKSELVDEEMKTHLHSACVGREVSLTSISAYRQSSFGKPYVPEHLHHEDNELHAAGSLEELLSFESARLYAIGPNSDVQAVAQKLRQHGFAKLYDISAHESKRNVGRALLELRKIDANKGSALRWLREHEGIAGSAIAVAGDYRNDIPMFQKEYLKVTFGDAVAELRSLADFVCRVDDDHGGIDEFFELLVQSKSAR